MEIQQLLEWFDKRKNQPNHWKKYEEYHFILKITSFLDDHYSEIKLAQRMWHINNNDYNLHKCKLCGFVVNYNHHAKSYSNYCSISCASDHKHNNFIEIKPDLFPSTNFLLQIFPNVILSQRLWHYNNTFKIPTCKVCEKYVEWKKGKYNLCCCEEHLKQYYGSKQFSEIQRNSTKPDEESINLTDEEFLKKYETTPHLLGNSKRYEKIKKITEFLPNNATPKQRLWHIKNNINEQIKCEICGKTLKWICGSYNSACSIKCSKKLSSYDDNITKTNLKKYGTPYAISNNNVKEKIKETLLIKYGVKNASNLQSVKDKRKDANEKLVETIIEKDGYEKLGYIFLKTEKNENETSWFIKCPKCEKTFEINSKQFAHRRSRYQEICTNCNPIEKGYSIDEKSLLDFIMSIYNGEIHQNTRSIISPYELDIYLPDLNLAIEYNGLYWHSSDKKKNTYHRDKSNMCKELGIHLIHVFEDDWNYKQKIIKSILSNFINKTDQISIYARKCIVKEVSFVDTNDFLLDNHLLGSLSSFSKSYGLYYQDELISLMTFKLISKDANNYELSRYAIKINTNVIGGAKRLLKQFLRNIEFNNLITYNDNSVFKGNVYRKLGFQYIRTNFPNYMFIDNKKKTVIRISKQSIRKLNVGYKIETEKELGLLRVYNAGNDVYVLEK